MSTPLRPWITLNGHSHFFGTQHETLSYCGIAGSIILKMARYIWPRPSIHCTVLWLWHSSASPSNNTPSNVGASYRELRQHLNWCWTLIWLIWSRHERLPPRTRENRTYLTSSSRLARPPTLSLFSLRTNPSSVCHISSSLVLVAE